MSWFSDAIRSLSLSLARSLARSFFLPHPFPFSLLPPSLSLPLRKTPPLRPLARSWSCRALRSSQLGPPSSRPSRVACGGLACLAAGGELPLPRALMFREGRTIVIICCSSSSSDGTTTAAAAATTTTIINTTATTSSITPFLLSSLLLLLLFILALLFIACAQVHRSRVGAQKIFRGACVHAGCVRARQCVRRWRVRACALVSARGAADARLKRMVPFSALLVLLFVTNIDIQFHRPGNERHAGCGRRWRRHQLGGGCTFLI